MHFWNGNKSPARRRYELDVLEAVLAATEPEFGSSEIEEDRTDYPKAEDEASIFLRGVDVLVTVAGNAKFDGKEKIEIDHPLAQGLLGHRILAIKQERLAEFAAINTNTAMREKVIGIPATWADADLFRANGFPVIEKGSFEEIFRRLKNAEFDYVALGAIEIEEAYKSLAEPIGGLAIEKTIVLRYALPLIFLVHPLRPELARRIGSGLTKIAESGKLGALFDQHFGKTIAKLGLHERKIFELKNPALPSNLVE